MSNCNLFVPVTCQILSLSAGGGSVNTVVNHNHRLILPATSQRTVSAQQPTYPQIRPAPAPSSVTNTLNQLPPGTTIISSGQNVSGVQGFALVPAQYVPQVRTNSILDPPAMLGDSRFQM